MNHILNNSLGRKNRGYKLKISEINKILQKYRNSALTYDLIRKIVYDMSRDILISNVNINDINNDSDTKMLYK